jgi:hypothetical protein
VTKQEEDEAAAARLADLRRLQQQVRDTVHDLVGVFQIIVLEVDGAVSKLEGALQHARQLLDAYYERHPDLK